LNQPTPFGKYYLLERINVGGMAEVFKAKVMGVEGFERIVALKRILPHIAEDEEFITMFIDEAKIAVQLQHANIAQIFDLGKVDEAYFIALEYVHGRDLRGIFDDLHRHTQTMPLPQVCFVIMQVCEGLDYAHNKRDAQGRALNLVHRDISPQNVLIGYEGEVKLIDFGIAKAAGKASKTQAGILKGKFGYMSPEQVRGTAHRPAQRHLRPGNHSLRDAHGPAAVRGRERFFDLGESPQCGDCPAVFT
jgi:serine/threonine protein kinase